MSASRETWSSRQGFVLATIGSAVGLGNIWRFSYVAGENGGGAFLFVYLFFVVVVGLPVVIAELAIGRLSQGPVGSGRLAVDTDDYGFFAVMAGFERV